MNRRAFIGAMAGAAALTGAHVAASQKHPDRFVHGGWDVRWRGWQEPSNQIVKFGIWEAMAYPAFSERHVYSTTLGVVREARPLEVLDITIEDRSAPHTPGLHTDAEFEAAKEWACRRLLKKLDAMK